MDLMPTEMLTKIFRYLDMNDHLKCRLVNKKCQFVIDNNIKINELAIRNSKDCRFTKLFYDLNYHSIEHGVFLWTSNVYLFNTKHLTERLKNLRRLFIDLPCANQARKMFSFLTGYNQLTKLEQLEFRSINLNRPESLHLPNLRMLAVQYSYGNLLTLNMPSLNSFATNDSLAKFEFEFPLVLTHLSVELFEEAILRFTNLTHLRIQMFEYDSGLIFRIIPTDLPRVLLQLRELHCRNWVRRDVVYNMIANKILAKQNDFVFFHFGVRLDTLDDLADATPDGEVAYLRDGDLAANFSWILSHFAKLDAVLPWIHKIDYNGLASGGHIDADFFRRFLNVQKIIVDTRVEDAAAFTQFLRQCKELKNLKLVNTDLKQLFFDRLPEVQPYIQKLTVKSSTAATTIDMNFITRFKSLSGFKTDQRVPFELVKKMVDEGALEVFEFKMLKTLKLSLNGEGGEIYMGEEETYFESNQDLIEFVRKLYVCLF